MKSYIPGRALRNQEVVEVGVRKEGGGVQRRESLAGM